MEFDRYTVSLLVRPPSAPHLDPKVGDDLQDRHLAHLARLHDEGHLLAAGPLVGGPDPSVRGLMIVRGSVDDARAMAAEDPLVRAGCLELRSFPWQVPRGAVTFSHTRFPRSSAEAR